MRRVVHRPARAANHTSRRSTAASNRRGTIRVVCKVAVGIDLGTSNSAVAIVTKGAAPQVLSISSSRATCPSIVAFTKEGVHVGHNAKHLVAVDPVNTFSSTKRLIGQKLQDVQDMAPLLPYRLVAAADGSAHLHCSSLDRQVAPEEVGAEILRYLLEAVQQQTGEVVQQAVITVPAYFSQHQREATIRAGQMAGLLHVSLLQEPVAAAMAHGFGMDPYASDTILVADLGGGTFDVSLLDGFEGILEVLATDGDACLGGDDFDRLLAEHLLSQLPADLAARIRADPSCVQAAVAAAEAARVKLSSQEEAAVQLLLPGGVMREVLKVTREEMERVVEPLLRRLWAPLQRLAAATHTEYISRPCFDSSGAEEEASSSQADAVRDKWAPPPRRATGLVMVGGASQMPLVRRLLEQITGLEPRSDVDPSTGVALGAAVQAGVMTGLLEVGPELMDGSYMVSLHERASGFQY